MCKTKYSSPNTSIFPIWAEENGGLANTTYEWAFGNGANTPSDCGIVMYVPPGAKCHCVAMGLSINGGLATATVELVLNGAVQGANCNVSLTSGQQVINDSFTPLEISNGDWVTFRTTSASGTSGPCQVVAWFKMIMP